VTTTPKPTLDERRDAQSDDFIKELMGDCEFCDINQASFIRGWDACRAEMQAEIEDLKKWDARWSEKCKRQREEIVRLREALESISKNSCCEQCQEAKIVARKALEGK
jgi:hypothetical protein